VKRKHARVKTKCGVRFHLPLTHQVIRCIACTTPILA